MVLTTPSVFSFDEMGYFIIKVIEKPNVPFCCYFSSIFYDYHLPFQNIHELFMYPHSSLEQEIHYMNRYVVFMPKIIIFRAIRKRIEDHQQWCAQIGDMTQLFRVKVTPTRGNYYFVTSFAEYYSTSRIFHTIHPEFCVDFV